MSQDPKHDPKSGHDSGELEFELPAPAKPSPTRIVALGAGLLVAIGAAFVIGYLPRHRAKQELGVEAQAASTGLLRVQVLIPKAKSSDRAMTLPASVQPLEEATVYPRANGYVRTWKVDMGDAVKEGDLLAEIDTPEIDQQLAQARAQLAQAEAALVQAKANKGYAQTSLDRLNALAPKGVASQQELEKAKADAVVSDSSVEVAEANVAAMKANLGRIQQTASFSRVTAPFTGTVNMRGVERGSLVSPSTPLFKISQTDTVRVFIQVPQDVAPSVRVDAPAQVTVREFAGRVFEGKVARTAASLDATSRTMNVEVRVPNPKRELLAGMYAQVAVTLPSPHRVWELPATAVMTDARGVRVAVVENGVLRLTPVRIERDNGATIDIASGIEENDRIVKIGNAELHDGRAVEVVPEAAAAAAPGSPQKH
ncbi:MAG: efflux RND transporter periplasmic adaptor subunit [Labilithrix sp.]|nr:efflux RND transporter periplasmic adaptor subunit [Labilithrix sp.]MCW5817050.1 efflux RND transporter periplasmic adaptor subunit [Labilithrix sp.]